MHKTLIITAHPSTMGFTHLIANAFKEGREKAGGEVEILDLYKTDLKQDFLKFENVKEIESNSVCDVLQKKIIDANEIVFVHPMWWISVPAIMKNFIDNNFSSGFAYKYEKGSFLPKGLLSPRTARVYITCDGSMILYLLLGLPFWVIWKFGILNFCGMKIKSFSVFDKKRKSTQDRQDKFLEKVRRQASKI